MKRTLIIIVHTLAVLCFAAGLMTLHMNAAKGQGLSWIGQEQYEESALFSGLFNEDLARVKRLAVLKDAFEEDGELSLSNNVLRAETDQGMLGKSLSSVMADAQKFGYRMDSTTHRLQYTDVGNAEVPDYTLRVTYKSYDPYYFERQEVGPSVGITTNRELCIEVMRALQEYYSLKEMLETDRSNFYYSYHYLNDNGEYSDISNSGYTEQEIMTLGKYAALAERNGEVLTNITPEPDIRPEPTKNMLADNSDYSFYAGVDTNFMYADRYQSAAMNYEGDVHQIYTAIILTLVSAVCALVSFILLFRDGPDKRRTYAADEFHLEFYAAYWVVLTLALYFLIRRTIYPTVADLMPAAAEPYLRKTVKCLILYLGIYQLLMSVVRRYRRGMLVRTSIVGRLAILAGQETGTAFAVTLRNFGSYVLICTALGAGALLLCMDDTPGSGRYGPVGSRRNLILLGVLAMLFLVLNAYVFVRMISKAQEQKKLSDSLRRISEGETGLLVDEKEYSGMNQGMAESINHISTGLRTALNEQVKAERLKADLITNVSHDIRTPLTSIINYVDLLKREDIKDEKLNAYIDVLDKKSERLKNLTEDLLEASKASSGNIRMEMTKLDLKELAMQAAAEFDDKYAKRGLELEISAPEEPVYVLADGRHLWRVFENLYNNAGKYALENTRIYVDVLREQDFCRFIIKNISAQKLNIRPEELTERFVRGDLSRSTEGSGLGLSIAESLTKLMNGVLKIEIDGDLYKAIVSLPAYEEPAQAAEAPSAAPEKAPASAPETLAAAASAPEKAPAAAASAPETSAAGPASAAAGESAAGEEKS